MTTRRTFLAQLQAALQAAGQAMKDADAALKAGDFAAYGKAQDRLRTAIQQALAAQAQLGVKSSGATTSPTAGPTTTATGTPSPSSTAP